MHAHIKVKNMPKLSEMNTKPKRTTSKLAKCVTDTCKKATTYGLSKSALAAVKHGIYSNQTVLSTLNPASLEVIAHLGGACGLVYSKQYVIQERGRQPVIVFSYLYLLSLYNKQYPERDIRAEAWYRGEMAARLKQIELTGNSSWRRCDLPAPYSGAPCHNKIEYIVITEHNKSTGAVLFAERFSIHEVLDAAGLKLDAHGQIVSLKKGGQLSFAWTTAQRNGDPIEMLKKTAYKKVFKTRLPEHADLLALDENVDPEITEAIREATKAEESDAAP
jgi:hypothetical protein